MITCLACKESLPVTSFSRTRSTSRGRWVYCSGCVSTRGAELTRAFCPACGESRDLTWFKEMDPKGECSACRRKSHKAVRRALADASVSVGGRMSTVEVLQAVGFPRSLHTPEHVLTCNDYLERRGIPRAGNLWKLTVHNRVAPELDFAKWATPDRRAALELTESDVRRYASRPKLPRILWYAALALDDELAKRCESESD